MLLDPLKLGRLPRMLGCMLYRIVLYSELYHTYRITFRISSIQIMQKQSESLAVSIESNYTTVQCRTMQYSLACAVWCTLVRFSSFPSNTGFVLYSNIYSTKYNILLPKNLLCENVDIYKVCICLATMDVPDFAILNESPIFVLLSPLIYSVAAPQC